LFLSIALFYCAMRIGLLTSELNHNNGWAHYSLSVAQALQNQGLEVKIVAAGNSPIPDNLDVLPLLPTVTPPDKNTLVNLVRHYPQSQNFLSDCDIVHSTIEIYAPLAAAIAGKRPLFITAHGSYVHLPKIRSFPINWLYRHAFEQSTLICVSQYTAKVAQQILPNIQTAVIPNAVNPDRFANLSDISQIKIRPTIVTSGGVKARKGTLQLIRAVAKVRETLPNIQCIIIGNTEAEPNYTKKVQSEIKRLQLENTVQLFGFVEERILLYWYAMADVFVLPSINVGWKFEGFGLVHLEASAAGLPVIGTTDCGAEEAIEHGITGLLVNQARVNEELPEAILDILTHPEKAKQMGMAGMQRTKSQTWDKVAQQLIRLYSRYNG
jgi:phosphatidyl-myo-inositol dimannoside synthase